MLSVLEPTQNPNPISLKVLIVEDGYQTIKLLGEGLCSEIRYSFIIQQVRQSCQALTRLSQEAFDLVVVHLSNADSHVFDTVTQIKQLGLTLPILGLRANADEPLTLQVIQAGTPDDQVTENLKVYRLIRALRYAIDNQQRQESQRLNQEKYCSVIDNVKEVIFQTDTQEHWTFLNRAWTEITGFAIAESIGTSFLNGIHPDDLQKGRDNFDALITGVQQSCRPTVRYLTKSGDIRWLEVHARTNFAADGTVSGTTGTLNDITEQVLTQSALRISEERLQMALSGSDLGLWDWQLITGDIYFNPQWKGMLGYEPEEIDDNFQAFEQLVHPEDLSRVKAGLNAYLDRLIPAYEVEFRMRCKTGEWKWILSRGKVFEWDKAGNPVRMTGTHRDISDRRQAEDALRESEARERKKAYQLELALCELKNAQAQLVQTKKMASLGQLVAGIAHEINNPMSFIAGNVSFAHQYGFDLLKLIDLYQQYYPHPVAPIQEQMEAVELDFLRTDFPKALNSIREGVARIQQIVRSLQHFSHLNEAQMKTTDLNQRLESTLILLQNRFHKKPHQAVIEVNKELAMLPKVECYPGQLNQVFINVLSNAIEALEEKSQQNDSFIPQIGISTEIAELNSTVIIRICDNGLGIPAHLQEHLFEPFFTTKPVGQGTGLGLAVSYQIIEKHKGKITCNSQVGIGTEFVIEIPITLSHKTKQLGRVQWLRQAIGA
ncbi:MAG: PAS domain-containing protein [Coleofasciculus chthonoplastes F3-SA18-01]|uniref:PAS domain-containing protein n=1 Tax=Coleofasciculus chthonoplastes TaxID=64178 RepID=UPI0032F438CB